MELVATATATTTNCTAVCARLWCRASRSDNVRRSGLPPVHRRPSRWPAACVPVAARIDPMTALREVTVLAAGPARAFLEQIRGSDSTALNPATCFGSGSR
jgi:hypothetical protein